jgi:hypothetical protein
MKNSNYDLVYEICGFYDDVEIENDFKSKFKVGSNISKDEFFEFFESLMDDMSEIDFIENNWRYVESGGDWSILEEDEWG